MTSKTMPDFFIFLTYREVDTKHAREFVNMFIVVPKERLLEFRGLKRGYGGARIRKEQSPSISKQSRARTILLSYLNPPG